MLFFIDLIFFPLYVLLSPLGWIIIPLFVWGVALANRR